MEVSVAEQNGAVFIGHDDCPKCDKCGVPVTTGMLPMLCPHARACAFVEDDEHWQTVEEFRQDLGIERLPVAGVMGTLKESDRG
jgi:hypothetical protein